MASALSITDLKKGTIFVLNGQPYRVLDYKQKVMGRGGSIVNVKIKSLSDGHILEKTFKGNDTFELADVTTSNAQFLYADDTKAYFMDNETYETKEISKANVSELLKFINEGTVVQLLHFRGSAIAIDPPKNVYLKVTYTENAVKGDTSSAITKDAKVETGATVKVPPFIKTGDIISVDTTTGIYRERKKD